MKLAIFLVLVTSCRAWREDFAIKSVDECIEKKCTDHEPTAREECRTTCQRRFRK